MATDDTEKQSIKRLVEVIRNKYLQASINNEANLIFNDINLLISAFEEARPPKFIATYNWQRAKLNCEIYQLQKNLAEKLSLIIPVQENGEPYISKNSLIENLSLAFSHYNDNKPFKGPHLLAQYKPIKDLKLELSAKILDFTLNKSNPERIDAITILKEQIEAISATTYDKNSPQEKKIRALCDLSLMLVKETGKSTQDIFKEWKNKPVGFGEPSNYEVLSEHRRLDLWATLNFTLDKPNSDRINAITVLQKQIETISATTYDKNNLKEKKLRTLCDLGRMLMEETEKPIQDIFMEWKNKPVGFGSTTNYEVLSEHRRTGVYNFFSLSKTNTQKFIDDLEASFAQQKPLTLSSSS